MEVDNSDKTKAELSLNLPSNDNKILMAQRGARASFFTTPPEPVRLDPFKMFGMGKKPEEENKEMKSPEVEVSVSF